MYKRFAGFSLVEWLLIALGAAACGIAYYLVPVIWWKLAIVGYVFGFFFEASMEPLFTYNRQIRDKHCLGKTDINFLFPLGWLEISAFTMLLAEKVLPFPVVPAYVVGCFIAGNINEFVFYKMGCWVYHYNAKQIGNFRPFMPKITISGVPIQVIFGYGIVGLIIYFIRYLLF